MWVQTKIVKHWELTNPLNVMGEVLVKWKAPSKKTFASDQKAKSENISE